MLGNSAYTFQQQIDWVWQQVAATYPKFKHAHCSVNDPHLIHGLVVRNCHNFCGFPGAKVMDIGANVGVWSAFCAVHGAQVTAYEPYIGSYSVMIGMITKTGLEDKIIPINKAVWTYTGQCPFHGIGGNCGDAPWTSYNGAVQIAGVLPPAKPRESTQGRFRGNASAITKGMAQINCISLEDAVGNQEWDAVKIDIEGAEFELLLNTSDETLQKIKYLTVEFHPAWADLELYQKLMVKLGRIFSFDGIFEGDPQFAGEPRYQCLWATRR